MTDTASGEALSDHRTCLPAGRKVWLICLKAGEYVVLLVKKNEMLYSERVLYIFRRDLLRVPSIRRGAKSSGFAEGTRRKSAFGKYTEVMIGLLKKWSAYG